MILGAIYLFILSLIFAFLEIEIEGKFGWAEKLPTWYKKSGLGKIFFSITKKPLTGYHLFMLSFILLILHFIFFTGISWSLSKELEILAYFTLIMLVEDFLWFIFNPNYGLKNFKRDKIWWHNNSKWILNLFPLDYLLGIVIIILLFLASALINQNINIFYNNLLSLAIIGLLVFLSSSTLVKPYRKWYNHIRKNDDRKAIEIFR